MNLDAITDVDSTYFGRKQVEAVKIPQLEFSGREQYFLEQLRREERRAIRSNAPLSIALIHRHNKKPSEFGKLEKIFELLQKNARETDVVCYLSGDSIGVLLTDTDEKGTQTLRKRIVMREKNFPFSFIASTYPDPLFHDLLTEKQESYATNSIERNAEGSYHSDVEKLSYISRPLRVDSLSKLDFLERLRLEQRRVDRSKNTLSIALIWLVNGGLDKPSKFKEVLGLLQKNIRETDIVGNLSKDVIGILLPDTDDQRRQDFKKRIVNSQRSLPALVMTGTYPDKLFQDLLTGSKDRPYFYSLFLTGFREPAQRWYTLKRGIDIVGSLVGITLFSPLILITAVAIKLDSPGPVFFKQKRLGKRGVPFNLYKFRSMHLSVDDRIHRDYITHLIQGNLEEINQGDKEKPLYKIKSDPRVTLVGRVIRKTSIDELPQLFNVLRGEMSLVGPRPPLFYEVEKYQSWHLMRVLKMKPGITGLWQVSGRSETTFDEMVRLDIRYIRNWSFLRDIKILIKTVKVVLRSTGG